MDLSQIPQSSEPDYLALHPAELVDNAFDPHTMTRIKKAVELKVPEKYYLDSKRLIRAYDFIQSFLQSYESRSISLNDYIEQELYAFKFTRNDARDALALFLHCNSNVHHASRFAHLTALRLSRALIIEEIDYIYKDFSWTQESFPVGIFRLTSLYNEGSSVEIEFASAFVNYSNIVDENIDETIHTEIYSNGVNAKLFWSIAPYIYEDLTQHRKLQVNEAIKYILFWVGSISADSGTITLLGLEFINQLHPEFAQKGFALPTGNNGERINHPVRQFARLLARHVINSLEAA